MGETDVVSFRDYDFIRQIQSGELDVITWLAEQDEDSIRDRVYSRIPDDLDVSEGSYLYDATEPSNTEFAIAYFMLRNIIYIAFPQHSFGEWLDYAAALRGMSRNPATYATGKLTIRGAIGTVIPLGSVFSNTIPNGSTIETKYYSTIEEAVIGDEGIVEVTIQADTAGTEGNANAGEINLNIQDIKDIISVMNEKALTNGVAEESDKSLTARILEAARNQSTSGNQKSYKKWAKEVSGVVDVDVVPIWAGPGTVKVIIVGEGGIPIPDLIGQVKEHLDPADHEGEGVGCAPIGAVVTVATVENFVLNIWIQSIEVADNYPEADAKENIYASLKQSISEIRIGGLIRLRDTEDAIKHAEGILDFGDVRINGLDRNIQVGAHLKPIIGEVTYG